ncbi:hypothetical protein DID88_008985 [Monilinia fructigena]|uniref:Uncharacterized protein n=1 Tax=Monilinia fructigena TaxID=38457 RepID=A0A395IFB0_9HELO|nr:hypothetical protein DID88_008985 [Monilinia fructigena]
MASNEEQVGSDQASFHKQKRNQRRDCRSHIAKPSKLEQHVATLGKRIAELQDMKEGQHESSRESRARKFEKQELADRTLAAHRNQSSPDRAVLEETGSQSATDKALIADLEKERHCDQARIVAAEQHYQARIADLELQGNYDKEAIALFKAQNEHMAQSNTNICKMIDGYIVAQENRRLHENIGHIHHHLQNAYEILQRKEEEVREQKDEKGRFAKRGQAEIRKLRMIQRENEATIKRLEKSLLEKC